MANITNLEMGKAVSGHIHVAIKKSFFGLKQTGIYTPTMSPIDVKIFDFNQDLGKRIEKMLNCPDDKLEEAVKEVGKINSVTIGNVQLEVCLSQDHQFAALQLFKYAELMYHPVTPPRFYEGEKAVLISSLF